MRKRYVGMLFLILSLVTVVLLAIYTNSVANQLAEEEQKKMQIWAEAQGKLMDDDADLDFVLKILEQNTTIPVYIIDDSCHVLAARNVGTMEDSLHVISLPLDTAALHGPIPLIIDGSHNRYIYYDDSSLLSRLQLMPYIQFGLVFIFLGISLALIFISHKSEKNRLWAGLGKETAHQLGTPISSLNAWQQLLIERYPDDELIPQMELDIRRLTLVAERFSKIGSVPELQQMPITPVIDEAVAYISKRVSTKVHIEIDVKAVEHVRVEMSAPLLEWVIENICRNGIDAMSNVGTLRIWGETSGENICIYIQDTGKGIEPSIAKRIFEAGFTTKKRGWGIGLTLSKRIVEQYHGGRLYIQSTKTGVGTTFCIQLKQAK